MARFQAGVSTPVSANDQPAGMVVADGNGDGKPDVILSGASSPYYLQGNGEGTFNAADSGNFFVGVNSKHLKTADLTGQGLPSLLMTSGATIQVFVAAKPAVGSTATNTTLTVSNTSVATGQSVTLTAVVAPQSGSGVPTGTVNFLDGTTSPGTSTLDSTGKATLASSSLAVGAHSITAAYQDDATFAPSTSAAVTITVTAATPDFSVSATPTSQTVSPGQSTSYKLTLTPINGFSQAVAVTCTGAPAT